MGISRETEVATIKKYPTFDTFSVFVFVIKPFCLFVYLFLVFTFYFLVSVVVVDLWMFHLTITVTKQNNSLNSTIWSKRRKQDNVKNAQKNT